MKQGEKLVIFAKQMLPKPQNAHLKTQSLTLTATICTQASCTIKEGTTSNRQNLLQNPSAQNSLQKANAAWQELAVAHQNIIVQQAGAERLQRQA